jgi:hypothetical protein
MDMLIIVALVLAGVLAYALKRVTGGKHRRWMQSLDALRELPEKPAAPPGQAEGSHEEPSRQSCNWRLVRPTGSPTRHD